MTTKQMRDEINMMAACLEGFSYFTEESFVKCFTITKGQAIKNVAASLRKLAEGELVKPVAGNVRDTLVDGVIDGLSRGMGCFEAMEKTARQIGMDVDAASRAVGMSK